MKKSCSIEGCERAVYGWGWCGAHYQRWRIHGDPLGSAPPRPTVAERFWAKVDKNGPVPPERPDLGPCWIWTAGLDGAGYGRYWLDGRMVSAHALPFGPIEPGLERDHLCRVPACVRPDHIEAVTHTENVRRGDRGRRYAPATHCKRGHPFDAENTRIESRGSRTCRACDRERYRASRGG